MLGVQVILSFADDARRGSVVACLGCCVLEQMLAIFPHGRKDLDDINGELFQGTRIIGNGVAFCLFAN